ncbi:MAG: glycosyltransferase family 39 protein [Chloroflexi bacterium]|nr:glycosyltransferase family 39 protein [Chloroflexota bacterium]
MQRIHREARWYLQYLYPNQSSTKYFVSTLLVATSSLPVMLLFQSVFAKFEVISSILTLIATVIGAICVRRINNQQGGPYALLSGVLALLYTSIGILRWGITPTYIDFWGGLLSFVLSVVLVVIAMYVWLPNHTVTEASQPLTAIEFVGLVCLAMSAFALRWYQLDTLPAATNAEALQSLYATTAWNSAATNPIALTPSMTSQFTVLLQGLSSDLFGMSINAVRYVSVILGTATVVITFLATRMFFDGRTAWFSAIVLMAMSSHIEFSRLAISVVADTTLIAAIVYALASAWGKGLRRWYLLAGILLSLTQYTYHTGKIIPVIFAIWLCLYALQYWTDVESRLTHLTAMWGITLLGSLPHWWSIVVQRDQYTTSLLQVNLFGTNYQTGQTWLQTIASQQQLPDWQVILYSLRDAAAGFIAVPLRDLYEIGLPMLTIPAAVVFLFGILIMAREYADPRNWLIFLGLLSAVCIAALTINTPSAQRMIFVAPFVAMVIGIGIADMGKWFRIDWIQHDWNINPRIIQLLSGVLVLAIAGYDAQSYIGTTRNALTNPVDQSANAIRAHAKDYPAGSDLYLFTQPELYYHESALLQFSLPNVTGIDVYPPLQAAPTWQLSGGTTLFVFSQARLNELSFVRQFYPGGRERRVYASDGEILLVFYEVNGIHQQSTP